MKNLRSSESHFVFCINPNMVKSGTVWTESVVEHQLRCRGLVEALKSSKYNTYDLLVPGYCKLEFKASDIPDAVLQLIWNYCLRVE